MNKMPAKFFENVSKNTNLQSLVFRSKEQHEKLINRCRNKLKKQNESNQEESKVSSLIGANSFIAFKLILWYSVLQECGM